MAAALSRADHYRRMRESFVLAQQLGCTPAQAAEVIVHREAIERHRSIMKQLHILLSPPPEFVMAAAPAQLGAPAQPNYWWNRD